MRHLKELKTVDMSTVFWHLCKFGCSWAIKQVRSGSDVYSKRQKRFELLCLSTTTFFENFDFTYGMKHHCDFRNHWNLHLIWSKSSLVILFCFSCSHNLTKRVFLLLYPLLKVEKPTYYALTSPNKPDKPWYDDVIMFHRRIKIPFFEHTRRCWDF